MKNISYLLLALVAFFTTSCEKHWNFDFEEIEYGFNTEIHESSKELIIMKVNDATASIRLKGNIELYNGKVEITLVNPDGNTVFEESITGKTEIEVNKTFAAHKGYWKLSYKSIDGMGFINLHLNQ